MSCDLNIIKILMCKLIMIKYWLIKMMCWNGRKFILIEFYFCCDNMLKVWGFFVFLSLIVFLVYNEYENLI